jgi:hypothetical protein
MGYENFLEFKTLVAVEGDNRLLFNKFGNCLHQLKDGGKAPLKCWSTSTRIHSLIPQKTVIFILGCSKRTHDWIPENALNGQQLCNCPVYCHSTATSVDSGQDWKMTCNHT